MTSLHRNSAYSGSMCAIRFIRNAGLMSARGGCVCIRAILHSMTFRRVTSWCRGKRKRIIKRLAIPFTPQFYLFFKPVQISNPPKISFLFPYPNTFSLICFRFLFCLGAIKHIVRFLKGIQDVFFRGIAPGKADTNRGNLDILLSPFVKLFVECTDHVLHLPHVSGHDHAKLVPTEAITGANPSEG